jgi:hypothetical protein
MLIYIFLHVISMLTTIHTFLYHISRLLLVYRIIMYFPHQKYYLIPDDHQLFIFAIISFHFFLNISTVNLHIATQGFWYPITDLEY